MLFKPDSELKRHQKYFDAFSVKNQFANQTTYLTYITRFIGDEAISYQNDDDIQFFRDLLFESEYGKVHIEYYRWVLDKWIKFAFTQSMTIISKYANYLVQVSELFLKDMFHHVYKMDQSTLIVPALFNVLSPDNKVHLVKVGMDYPSVVKLIPKFKMYLLFS